MRSRIFTACIIGILSATTTTGFANPTKTNDYHVIIEQFIDSHSTANYKAFRDITDDNATVKMSHGEMVIVQPRADLLTQMKSDSPIKLNCDANYEVLAKSGALVIARVDFVHGKDMQHNYLTIEKNKDKEWKITQVCTFFEDINNPMPKEIAPKHNIIAKN